MYGTGMLPVGHLHENPCVCLPAKNSTLAVLAEVPLNSKLVLRIPGDSSANIGPQNDRIKKEGLRMTGFESGRTAPGGFDGFDFSPWANRVQTVDAEYAGSWELPAIGTVAAPTALLIRPDGYVTWVGDLAGQGLAEALTTWFGPEQRGEHEGHEGQHRRARRGSL